MAHLNEADRYLLEQLRRGSGEGWLQFVDRFQGRLLAYARSKARSRSDAEDLVQDTFISFLRLPRFREESTFETYLFTILRHKVIDAYRSGKVNPCLLQDVLAGRSTEGTATGGGPFPAPDPTASWYARRDEQRLRNKSALTTALRQLIDYYKECGNLRDLQIVEMVFYCQLRNKDIAEITGTGDNRVALLKHRCLARLREMVGSTLPIPEAGPAEDLISEIWQEQRLSCLKRSTLGAYLLGTLEDPWPEYIGFHLDRLGCSFCQANLDDLKDCDSEDQQTLRRQIMESTVGFLSRK